MKFFNIDLHVSVIRDIKTIFNNLGHEVDSLSLSGHDWVFGDCKKPEVITSSNWKNLDDDLLDKFYNHYKEKLEGYDGFIVTHTPFFCKLYERFNKPIIVVASTRYEYPYTNNKSFWEDLNSKLTSDNIILLANNDFDKKYCDLFLGTDIPVIESLCDYTNAQYNPSKKQSIIYSKFKIPYNFSNVVYKNEVGRLSWDELYSYNSIIHFPYNISTMSIFEQYCANVPLLLPSYEFSCQLVQNDYPVYSEVSYRRVLGLSSDSLFGLDEDPNQYNNKEVLTDWIKSSDFYKFENIVHFNSFQELDELSNKDLQMNSFAMKLENYDRKEKIYSQWKSILGQIT